MTITLTQEQIVFIVIALIISVMSVIAYVDCKPRERPEFSVFAFVHIAVTMAVFGIYQFGMMLFFRS